MENQPLVSAGSQRQNRRRFFQGHYLILFLIIFLLLSGVLVSIIESSWSTIVSVIFTALAVLLTAAGWLFPRIRTAFTHQSSLDPPAYPIIIVKRQRVVREIYNQLIDPNTSAIILRGLNGSGASTLARLVCSYEKNQRLRRTAPFFDSPLWVYLDADITIPGLARALSLPDISSVAPQRQPDQLLRFLNTPKMRRLIVLDFKNPLNKQTKDALADRPGFKEFLRTLNSRPCQCRILLTSRPWSSETFNDPAVCIQEYPIEGLTDSEGRALLQQYNIEGTYDELRLAIALCDGHVGALTLLSRVLTGPPSIELSSLLEDSVYRGRWMQEITKEFLAHIYRELSPIEQEMLFAFSIYRKPVRMEAARAIMTSQSSKLRDELTEALSKLIRRCFFLNLEEDAYQLHPIVAHHAQNHFSDPGNQTQLQEAHKKAADYYQRVVRRHLPFGQHSERVELLIEALYHLHQAEEDSEAYELLQQENLLPYLL
ncbi:MAG TPA: hypothetical protein VEP90_16295 [Methylomirabilota bacterium]|nr:hypothetical protein [Methylomirabilota bacterium]